jgi:hypothetical protein
MTKSCSRIPADLSTYSTTSTAHVRAIAMALIKLSISLFTCRIASVRRRRAGLGLVDDVGETI